MPMQSSAPQPPIARSDSSDRGKPRLCFVGLENLPVLAREYGQFGAGGEQVQHALLAKALVRRGFDVSMVVADHGQADGAVWDGVRTFKAYKVEAGLPVLRFVYPRWTGIWSAVKRASADVYYWSCAGFQLGLLALYAKRQRSRPRVIFRIAHDDDCAPKALQIKYWRDRKLYEYGLARADVILAQSLRQQEAMRANYRRESAVANMLVDRPTEDRSFEERDLKVLWVNNIRGFKRPDLALELAARLPEIQLHMVGGTQPGFEAMYRQISAQARGAANVSFHGAVPYHNVNELYERARVFVNTSDSEGFPNSYLQSWVRGTPVVAFFDPDGVIAREGLGYVVSSMEEMRDRVALLSSRCEEWRAVSQRCRQYMSREYSEDRILEPYLQALCGPA